MPNDEKVAAVAEITDHFANSSAAVITEYRGLTVKQVGDLRHALGRDTTYAVVKNTLTKRAARRPASRSPTTCWSARPRSPSSRAIRWWRQRGCATSRAATRC